MNRYVFSADDEEPDCMKCDFCLICDSICNLCGPEYGWAHYRRTLIENDDEDDCERTFYHSP